jgi:hypothetical protein
LDSPFSAVNAKAAKTIDLVDLSSLPRRAQPVRYPPVTPRWIASIGVSEISAQLAATRSLWTATSLAVRITTRSIDQK